MRAELVSPPPSMVAPGRAAADSPPTQIVFSL